MIHRHARVNSQLIGIQFGSDQQTVIVCIRGQDVYSGRPLAGATQSSISVRRRRPTRCQNQYLLRLLPLIERALRACLRSSSRIRRRTSAPCFIGLAKLLRLG